MNVSCALHRQRVFNHLAAITQVIVTFCWQKIYWLNGRLFVRKVGEDVKSPPVQKLYAWLTSLLSVGRGRRVSEVSAGNCQSTQHSLALVANSQWSTKLARSHTIIHSWSAKMLWCAYASFRLHQYIFKCATLSLYMEWSRVLLLNLGSRTGLPGRKDKKSPENRKN